MLLSSLLRISENNSWLSAHPTNIIPPGFSATFQSLTKSSVNRISLNRIPSLKEKIL